MVITLLLIAIGVAVGSAALAWRVIRRDRIRSAYRVEALGDAIDGTTGTTAMFGDPLAAFRDSRRFPLRAAVSGGMLIVVATVALLLSRNDVGSTPPQPAAAAPAPLELMEMSDRREASDLTIVGMVRNPPAGTSLSRVTAVVLGFDRSGAFVTSSRAELDFLSLQPGDESSFVVKVPNGKVVARYRVAFRTESGALRHVDRRERPTSVARHAQ